MLSKSAIMGIKIVSITTAFVIGGHYLVKFVTPTEEELLGRFSTEHKQRYLQRRDALRQQGNQLIEQAKKELN